jgi:poly(3-hydroxybutyrate) depolymerase
MWRQLNDCIGEEPTNEDQIALGIHESSWANCANSSQVKLVRIEGGIHSWPPGRMKPEQYIWNFFKEQIVKNKYN